MKSKNDQNNNDPDTEPHGLKVSFQSSKTMRKGPDRELRVPDPRNTAALSRSKTMHRGEQPPEDSMGQVEEDLSSAGKTVAF